MKKKVLFIMPSMFIGGAERSLIGLLDAFDCSKYDVDLFLYRREGEFLKFIPNKINVLPQIDKYSHFDTPIKSELLSKSFLLALSRLYGKFLMNIHAHLFNKNYDVWASMQYTSKSLQWLLPQISGTQYDLAIMFLGIPDVLLNKVDAKVKISWNHTDYSILGADEKYDLKLYSQLNYVASVSENCTRQFVNTYPNLKHKAITVENVLSLRFLQDQSKQQIEESFINSSKYTLLSIGRFCEAKNFDNVPDICKRIRQSGLDVKWYLIGYGGDEALIRQKIKEAGMEDYVIILGKKTNPYPYIKACDLYVQPSRYEGKAVTVREAQILHKPVVITDYATSASQLEDGVDGVVVPMDNAACAQGIADLLNNPAKMHELSENTKLRDYTNAGEVEKIYRLIEG